MSFLKVSKDNRTFEYEGKQFFYLSDTCWSAFTNIEDLDWQYYLDKRKSQGFNTLQINALAQWDRSQAHLNYLPFEVNSDGSFNFEKVNEKYFIRAKKMCEVAKEKGF